MKKYISIFAILALFAPTFSTFGAYNSATAKSYLATNSANPWSTMALSVLGASSIPTDHLKSVSTASAIGLAAPMLAITAVGADPRTFGSSDLVAAMKNFYDGTQIGDSTTLNDDFFGILALRASGLPASDTAIAGSMNFILSKQNSDGGWGFVSPGASDTNMTAVAILALLEAGVAKADADVQAALNYLKSAQNDDGGFPYDPESVFDTSSDSSSTAWVIWALNALDIDPASMTQSGGNPISYLESLQNSSGYFGFQSASETSNAFSAVTTAYAVIALSDRTLPLRHISPFFDFRIEGSDETVCAGRAAGPTALDVVKNASSQCGYTYNIESLSFGPYLNQINDDAAAGLVGWLYFVDSISPDVGAGDYHLSAGDQVLWYYGDFGWTPTRLNMSQTEISTGASVIVTVESFNGTSWSPLSGASVFYGTQTAATDAAGQATISPGDGFYKIFAEKDGAVRSNSQLLKVGSPSEGSVDLGLTFDGGAVAGDDDGPDGDTVSFSVSPDALDFGIMIAGGTVQKNLTITNSGDTSLHIESIVAGDEIFHDFLKLGNTTWQNFSAEIASGANQGYTAEIKIPSSYAGASGAKSGEITFWAIAE